MITIINFDLHNLFFSMPAWQSGNAPVILFEEPTSHPRSNRGVGASCFFLIVHLACILHGI